MSKQQQSLPWRGFLIHISHYDPYWCENKPNEKPFDLALGLDIVDAMAEAGLNLLVLDCADGVKYKSHPELTRPYSVPMDHLRKLARKAHENGIEVVPKLNFSQSRYYKHNDWFRPYHELFDNDEYFSRAFELIDELIDVCEAKRFFHIGMDEDNGRAHSQYINSITRLHDGLEKRGLRTVIWNDSALAGRGLVLAEKSIAAEKAIPKDIVQILWDYHNFKPEIVQRLVNEGFDVWVAPGRTAEFIEGWNKLLLHHGGKGLLLTLWIPCHESNRSKLIELIRAVSWR